MDIAKECHVFEQSVAKLRQIENIVMENQSVVLNANGVLSVEDRAMPAPGPGEVLVKVDACGVCSSDVPRAFQGKAYHYPLVMGHEFAGEVVDVGAGAEAGLLGNRVAVFPLLPCFDCEPCRREAYAQCVRYSYYGSRCDGAFTKYLAVRQWNVLPLPPEVDVRDAALTEPVAVALHGLNRLGLLGAEGQGVKRVLIAGTGFIGLAGAEILRMSCRDISITVLDRNQYKLDLIADPATEKVLIEAPQGLERLVTERANQFDVVIEATGAAEIFRETIRLVHPGGRVLWMGNIDADLQLPQALVSTILRKEIVIIGTWNSSYAGRSPSDWTQVMDLMVKGFRPSRYVTDFVPLEDLPEALRNLNKHKDGTARNNIFKVMSLPHHG